MSDYVRVIQYYNEYSVNSKK